MTNQNIRLYFFILGTLLILGFPDGASLRDINDQLFNLSLMGQNPSTSSGNLPGASRIPGAPSMPGASSLPGMEASLHEALLKVFVCRPFEKRQIVFTYSYQINSCF